MGRVAGKIALVTGGASGLGRASARMLAAEGARVVIGDVDEDVGYAVLYLASDESKFMTGAELVLDGGLTA